MKVFPDVESLILTTGCLQPVARTNGPAERSPKRPSSISTVRKVIFRIVLFFRSRHQKAKSLRGLFCHSKPNTVEIWVANAEVSSRVDGIVVCAVWLKARTGSYSRARPYSY